MTKLTVICIVLSYASLTICQQQGGGDLTDLINQVFSTENPNKENPSRGGDSNSGTDGGGGLNLDPNTNTGGSNTGSGIPGTDQCTCVPYYLCNNGSVNTNGEGVIDISNNYQPCAYSQFDVCCKKENIVKTAIPPSPEPYKHTECGHRNPDGIDSRIGQFNGSEAKYGEFPWMVAIMREEPIEGSTQVLNLYQCGGSLIHPRVVLTAAHCVTGKNKTFKIRAGEWDTQTKQELYPHQDRRVVRVIPHNEYYSTALFNDVALLYLESPLEIAENINIVCLPTYDANYDFSRCFASGWGKDRFGKEGIYQVILKNIDLPIVPRERCQEELRKTRLTEKFTLHSSFICAGGEKGKDTCIGDGGSPLVCPIPGQTGRYAQVGIVAWGIGCGSETPGVYGNVARFRNWIDTQMQSLNINERPYEHA